MLLCLDETVTLVIIIFFLNLTFEKYMSHVCLTIFIFSNNLFVKHLTLFWESKNLILSQGLSHNNKKNNIYE